MAQTHKIMTRFVVSCLNHQLPFLEHVHELDPGQCRLCGLERFEPQHGTRYPFDRSMVLFHDIIQIFHLPDDDMGAVLLIVALDGRFIRPAPINPAPMVIVSGTP